MEFVRTRPKGHYRASTEDADIYRQSFFRQRRGRSTRSLVPLPPDRWPRESPGLVSDKYVISDKGQELDVYPLLPVFEHVSSMLVAYLPREKMIINADVYEPPVPGKPLPRASAGAQVLYETIQRLGLDVTARWGYTGALVRRTIS